MSKKYKVFKWVFLFFFVIFLTLYFSSLTGYYEYQNYQKMSLTKEQIAQFEKDVKEGKEVDIKTYLEKKDNNYQNGFSNFGLTLSKSISETVEKGIVKVFSFISGFIAP